MECTVLQYTLSQSTVLHCKTHHCTLLYCTAIHLTALHCTALQYTSLHWTELHCNTHHCTALYYTVCHCTIMYCTAIHLTALHCTTLLISQYDRGGDDQATSSQAAQPWCHLPSLKTIGVLSRPKKQGASKKNLTTFHLSPPPPFVTQYKRIFWSFFYKIGHAMKHT